MGRAPIHARRRRANLLLLYLLLNIIVSAATTVTVLVLWDANKPEATPTVPSVGLFPTSPPTQPEPTATLPPVDQPVIQITSVIGAGDLEQENVVLQRLGTGDLRMVGWQLAGGRDQQYTFPEQPALTLMEGAEVQVYTKTGDDSVTALYWNRSEPVWQSGDTVRLLDSAGNERAIYTIP